MIFYVLKCLAISLNKNVCKDEEECITHMKALYAVIALLHVECKLEDASTNPLIEEPSSAFKEGGYTVIMENLKAIAEVTIMNINAAPRGISYNPDEYTDLLGMHIEEGKKNKQDVVGVSNFGS